MSNNDNCLHYWDLCSVISIKAAIALWCNEEPEEFARSQTAGRCIDAKREAIINALHEKRLEYEDRPVPRSDGRGPWYTASLDELIDKDGIRIRKDSLRRWFLELPISDRPPFLFDEARATEVLPDGGEIAEMNSMRALAVMAWILSENRPAMKIGDRPNAARIAEEVGPLAEAHFGSDTRGFASFNKKLSKALKLLKDDQEINNS